MTLVDPTIDSGATVASQPQAPSIQEGKAQKQKRLWWPSKKKPTNTASLEAKAAPTFEKVLVPKITNSTLDFLPFNRIVDDDCIEQTDGYYTDFLQFQMTPLNTDNDDEQDQGYRELSRQLLTYGEDVNWIFTEFPIDVSDNLAYLDKRKALVKKPTASVRRMTQTAHDLLQYMQTNKTSREAYLQLFAQSPDELEKMRQRILDANGAYTRLTQMTLKKKIQIIFKIFNPLHPVITGTPYQGTDPGKSHPRPAPLQKVVDKHHYDPAFLSQIQPMGGIGFEDQNTLNLGEGYLRTLHVYSYRKQNAMYWASTAFSGLGAIVTMSMKAVDTHNMTEQMSRALNEQESRALHSRTVIQQKEASQDYYSLNNLIDAMMSGGEVLFQVHTRIYVAAQTLSDTVIDGEPVPGLETKVRQVMDKLREHDFHAMSFADEARQEFQAALSPFTVQNKTIPRKGQEIRGRTLAGSYPFLFSQFLDPTGVYVGRTLGSNGYVTLNQFQHDRNRTSYSGWYVGKQGYGKSTAIKITARNNTLLGNYSYLFMVSSEAKKLVESLGGLHFDGSEAVVNFLQIMPLEVNDATNEIDQAKSFDESIAKASVIFNLASAVEEGSAISDTFIYELQEFYKQWIAEHDLTMDMITEYAVDQYPIASDFLAYLEHAQIAHKGTVADDTYTQVIRKLKNMMLLQSGLFNKATEFTAADYQIIAFDMRALTSGKQSIYNAQYYNLFNYVFSEAVKRGRRQKYLYEAGKLSADQVRATDIVSDEFHNVVRANNISLLQNMDRANREGRKLWIALHWATQNLADVFPNFAEHGEDEAAKAVRSLFALSPYRFIFRSDRANQALMDYVFNGEISESDMADIPSLETGSCVANIAGTTSISFKWEITDEEQRLFEGGI